jgi:hypothetical protein
MYFWQATVVLSVFYPIYALCLFPRNVFALFGSLLAFFGLLVSGVILLFRHRTFLALIPLIFAVFLGFILWAISQSHH